jgi:HD-GYP domain-containing protein (c-di-GMP phosphodiesterase class II)
MFTTPLTSRRPYREAMGQQKAYEILRENAANGDLDVELVRAFMENKVPELEPRHRI